MPFSTFCSCSKFHHYLGLRHKYHESPKELYIGRRSLAWLQPFWLCELEIVAYNVPQGRNVSDPVGVLFCLILITRNTGIKSNHVKTGREMFSH